MPQCNQADLRWVYNICLSKHSIFPCIVLRPEVHTKLFRHTLQHMSKSFCMHFRSQRNAGKDYKLTRAYIVNPPRSLSVVFVFPALHLLTSIITVKSSSVGAVGTNASICATSLPE